MSAEIIVALLLVSPVELPLPKKIPESLWDALKKVSLMLEVVGPHERWRSDFQAELRYVRFNWRELSDAPPQTDYQRFPPAAIAADYCRWNTIYQDYVKNRRWMFRYHEDYYEACLQEARQLCLIHKTVFEATDTEHSWVHQRRALRKLRELIGYQDYYAGRLPPVVPVWRFDLLD